ncbi:hypothetical protein KV205_35540 [Streptomyces sp. SKN60]|uniref:hypothetical protein n=1 Tax=Streptomyces sp. SKN60 TaxID=2855506 RepID=UPI0022459012|nr:hypothetical protein [Streptomyces sp. SKN60]MCX2185778.1 hypothetical protein [Streptomyces sp. SKN60]
MSTCGVTLEGNTQKLGSRDELLEHSMSLVTTFAGRTYGLRSAEAWKWLLAESGPTQRR